jgi:hypothetical protein
VLAKHVLTADDFSYFHRLKPCKQIALNATHAMDTLADLGTHILQSVLRLYSVTIVSTCAVLACRRFIFL